MSFLALVRDKHTDIDDACTACFVQAKNIHAPASTLNILRELLVRRSVWGRVIEHLESGGESVMDSLLEALAPLDPHVLATLANSAPERLRDTLVFHIEWETLGSLWAQHKKESSQTP